MMTIRREIIVSASILAGVVGLGTGTLPATVAVAPESERSEAHAMQDRPSEPEEVRTSRVPVSQNDCRGTGELPVTKEKGGCRLADWYDGTLFDWDDDALAVKIMGPEDRWKVEFHPKGQWLWVYDLQEDGDIVYVSATGLSGAVRAPVGKGVDVRRVKLNVGDDRTVVVSVWDDLKHNRPVDIIASLTARS